MSNDLALLIIKASRCDGCGLCVRVCPSRVWEVVNGLAVLARPGACRYSGLCEWACPRSAITRPLEIVSHGRA